MDRRGLVHLAITGSIKAQTLLICITCWQFLAHHSAKKSRICDQTCRFCLRGVATLPCYNKHKCGKTKPNQCYDQPRGLIESRFRFFCDWSFPIVQYCWTFPNRVIPSLYFHKSGAHSAFNLDYTVYILNCAWSVRQTLRTKKSIFYLNNLQGKRPLPPKIN